jgi:uncharacterized membrane protein YbhN (UPF0104 family)
VIGDAWTRATHAVGLLADQAVRVDPAWLALGAVLHLLAIVVRTRGWHTILRAAYPEADGLRPRHTAAAYVAGAGLNGIVPARGGDVLKLWLLRRRIPDSHFSTLAATFVPETLFETLFGTALVVWALSQGFLPVPTASGDLPALDVSFIVRHPVLSAALVAGAVLLAVGGWRVAVRRTRDLRARCAQGLAILGQPRRFVVGVAGWQALSRLIRLGSLTAFLAAFALPVTPATVVLVMAAQGGGRIVPLAPASAGLRLAMLAYGFAEVTGHAVDIAAITVFTAGVSAVGLACGLAAGAVALAVELGTLSPRRLRAAVRQAGAGTAAAASGSAPAPRPAPAGTGR